MATAIRDRLVDHEYLRLVRTQLERNLVRVEQRIRAQRAEYEHSVAAHAGTDSADESQRRSDLAESAWNSALYYEVELKFLLARLMYCEGASIGEFKSAFVDACELLLAAPEGSRLRSGFAGTLRFDIPALLSLFELDEIRAQLVPVLTLGDAASEADRRRVFDVLVGDERSWDDDRYPNGDRSEYPLPIHDLTFELAAQCRADPTGASDDLLAFVDELWIAGWTDADDPDDGNEEPRYPDWFFGLPPYPHWGHNDARLYTGYWCFEAAAFAKRFGVDDSSLAEHPYYPYDLARHVQQG